MAFTAVHPRHHVPHHAEATVGGTVAVLAAVVDLRGAIGFSSFAVLVYYAIANASAWTLRADEGRPPRIVPATGLLDCLVLAAGALLWLVRRGQDLRAFTRPDS